MPFTPLIRLDVPSYSADALPPELAAIPAVKPGPRLQTEALESLVGLHRALARIQAERQATPEQARRAPPPHRKRP